MVGECTGRRVEMIRSLGWGRMWIARGRNVYTYPGEPWGFDNGAYRDIRVGGAFDGDAYLRRLDKAYRVGVPYLAVIPDLPMRRESLAFSMAWLDRLPVWPWFLAVQDGTTPADVAPHMNRLAGIFLGGSDRFKATAGLWCDFAHSYGKPFHYGRAGTLAKLEHAKEVGADSIDSAFPMWTTSRWREFAKQWKEGSPQLRLIA